MGQAVLFSIIASSALVVGGTLGAFWKAPKTFTGTLLAFASGGLMGALCFELFPEAYELGGAWIAGLALLAGAAVFVIADGLLDRATGANAEDQHRDQVRQGAAASTVGLALLAAVTLDGVPENLALGVSLQEGASYTLLVAIFASNLPESLVGAVAMREGGQSPKATIGLWCVCAVLLAIAVVAGRALAGGLSDDVLAACLAFAGGAVLASLADTLMPEAYVHGRPFNAFANGAGFFLAFMLGVG